MALKRHMVSFLAAWLICLPGLAALSGLSGLAQTPPTQSQKELKELERKAVALLDETVNEAMSLRLVENRIHALTAAAELLWKRNQDRARALLVEATNQFLRMEQPTEPDDPRTLAAIQLRVELRTQLLQILAERDAPMALEFLRASRMPNARTLLGGKGGAPDFEQHFEMQLAIRIAENDPRMALQIAEESLKDGLNHQVFEIWSNLLNKDAKLAARLSSEIISKVRSSDLVKNHQSMQTALSMLNHLRGQIHEAHRSAKDSQSASNQSSSGQSSSGQSSSGQSSSGQSGRASLPEMQQTLRELLEIIVSATLKITAAQLLDINEQGPARNLLTQVQMLLPEIEKHLPPRAAQVRAKLNQFDKAFYHPTAPPEPFEEMEKKTPDELIALAAKSQPGAREMIYRQAVAKVLEQGDAERARRMAKEFLPDLTLGDPMLVEIEHLEREQAVKQGKLEEARQSLSRLRLDEERALALIALAAKAEANKDPKSHRLLLEEARALLGDQMDTRLQVEAQLALAAAYLNLDADRGFAILESAVDRLNVVVGAVMTLMKFDQGSGVFGANAKDGEMRLNAGEFGNVTTNFDQQTLVFARKDFDRTVAALKRWQVNEVRLAMSLMLAASILGEEKQTQYRSVFGERIH